MLMANLMGIRTTTIMMPPLKMNVILRLTTIVLSVVMCMRVATAANGIRDTPAINCTVCITTTASGIGMVKDATNKSWRPGYAYTHWLEKHWSCD